MPLSRILSSYRAAFSGLPADLWLLSAVALINRAGTMVLPFISLYLTQERGLSVARAGQIIAVYGLGSMAGSYVGGRLSDRLGADSTQRLSLILSGIGFLWLGELRDPRWITLAVFVVGVVAESFRPAAMAAMAQRAPQELQMRAFALLRLAVNLGMGLGPAIGGVLALYSYRGLFIVDAATSWAAAIVISLTLMRNPAAPTPRASSGVDLRRSPWHDGPFLCLILLSIGLATIFFQMWSTWPVYMREGFGFDEATIGGLLALNAFLIVAFEMVLIHNVEKREPLFLIGLGSFLTCLGLALLPRGRSLLFVASTMVVFTVGEMLAMPLLNAAVARRSTVQNRGAYMGLYTMGFSLAFVLAPPLGTWIYQHRGPAVLWYGIGVLGLVLWLAALLLRPAFHRPAD